MAGLKDIAEMTGVSVRTVSRALKNNGYVREDVREKILAAAQKLNYRPNRLAQSLKTSKSFEVTALAWSLDELHIDKIRGLETALRKKGYYLSLLAASEGSDKKTAEELAREILNRSPAAVAAFGVGEKLHSKIIRRLMDAGIPCVILDSPFAKVGGNEDKIDGIYVDRPAGVYDAVKYLISTGRDRILYTGIKGLNKKVDRTRLEGYERAMDEAGLKQEKLYISAEGTQYFLSGELSKAQFYAGNIAIRKISEMKVRPEAVLAFSDIMALGMLDELHRQNIRIPEEIAVVGFDNRLATSFSSPPLTTVAQPNREVGIAAAELLLAKINNEPEPECGWSRSLPATLIIRQST